MKRRRLLLGAGTLLGASAGLGTSAFTSVSVATAGDGAAFLGLEPTDSPNGTFASIRDGQLRIDLAETDAGGEGLGTDSVYEFDDVFRVTNRGTQPIYVWATFADADDSAFDLGGSNPDIYLYPNGDSGDVLRDSEDQTLYLPVGESATVGLHVDTHGIKTGGFDLTATIHADAAKPNASDAVGGDGTTIRGPSGGLVGYWPLDGDTTDIVGTSDGTAEGGLSFASGQLGWAASFDGEDDYIDIGDVLSLTESFSLSALVKTSESQVGFTRIISRELSGRGNRQYNLIFDRDGTTPRSAIDLQDGSTAIVEGSDSVIDGNWHRLTVTFDAASELRLYDNGTRVGSVSTDAPAVSRTTSAYLGTIAHTPGDRLYQGLLDDVRIYDRALSESEVQALDDATVS